MAEGVEIRLRGRVQGVGFRPQAWRIAREEGLRGEIRNEGGELILCLEGPSAAQERVLARLRAEAPPLARIEALVARPWSGPPFEGLRIRTSRAGGRPLPPPDAAMCAACRAEVLDPENRRFEHAFASCTDCGPRHTIAQGGPWDRERTTMAAFPLCPACAREYADPDDRRFHAQPIACPACGPTLWLEPGGVRGPAALAGARAALRGGGILALKGQGGFQLACDARNPAAVARLRAAKHRDSKPFAVLVQDLEEAARYAAISPEEAALLRSPENPIVLLEARGEALAPEVAPLLDTLGLLLPTTPLHLLLARDGPLVLTSGNRGGEPLLMDNEEALARLPADAFLLHDRAIANRVDDSVARVLLGEVRVLRRARGYTPVPLPLPPGFEESPSILAYGGELKATFCALGAEEALPSAHHGDLEDAETLAAFEAGIAALPAATRLPVTDAHPDYLSTKLAPAGSLRVQHHHAHLAACMGEHGLPRGARVLGVVFDGLGYGTDGAFWGGELMVAGYADFSRVGRLRPAALLGGVRAMREPWRNLYAQLRAAGWSASLTELADGPLGPRLARLPLDAMDRMLARGIQAHPSSSAGRLFDAVAAALGLCTERVDHEAQAAMALEALATRCPRPDRTDPLPFSVEWREGLLELDPAPLWHPLFAEPSPARAAWRFHAGLAEALAGALDALRERFGPRPVALAGGCFQNALLLTELHARVPDLLIPAMLPPHDGALAFGQALVGAARAIERRP